MSFSICTDPFQSTLLLQFSEFKIINFSACFFKIIVLKYTIKCIWALQVPESVLSDTFGPVKREAGERPARSRRCERGVLLPPQRKGGACHWGIPGKAKQNDDPQVRRPACNGYCVVTRNWLVRNERVVFRKCGKRICC